MRPTQADLNDDLYCLLHDKTLPFAQLTRKPWCKRESYGNRGPSAAASLAVIRAIFEPRKQGDPPDQFPHSIYELLFWWRCSSVQDALLVATTSGWTQNPVTKRWSLPPGANRVYQKLVPSRSTYSKAFDFSKAAREKIPKAMIKKWLAEIQQAADQRLLDNAIADWEKGRKKRDEERAAAEDKKRKAVEKRREVAAQRAEERRVQKEQERLAPPPLPLSWKLEELALWWQCEPDIARQVALQRGFHEDHRGIWWQLRRNRR